MIQQILRYFLIIGLLAGVFLSYLRSDLVIDLGNRLWGCG
ncbi:hypothetical protein LepocDRAFT_00002440 [Leptothrix ochracea L12]|uniref:Uncharacterized protein n=1 Tax=Leptothrix ochracea L12 TaxID=735332 RepID=I4Z5M1_9BURK|nr:hypothetical protein LepocDRAFT_00002440 [Leptothrix ochracea L12]